MKGDASVSVNLSVVMGRQPYWAEVDDGCQVEHVLNRCLGVILGWRVEEGHTLGHVVGSEHNLPIDCVGKEKTFYLDSAALSRTV